MKVRLPMTYSGTYYYGRINGDLDEMFYDLVESGEFNILAEVLNTLKFIQDNINVELSTNCKINFYIDNELVDEPYSREGCFIDDAEYEVEIILDSSLDKEQVKKVLMQEFSIHIYEEDEGTFSVHNEDIEGEYWENAEYNFYVDVNIWEDSLEFIEEKEN